MSKSWTIEVNEGDGEKNATLLLVSTHRIYRTALKGLLEKNFGEFTIHEAENYGDVMQSLQNGIPDMVLLDLSCSGNNGLTLLDSLKRAHPDVRVLMMNRDDQECYVMRAFRAGASGVIGKDSSENEFCNAVRAVMTGGIYTSTPIGQAIGLEGSDRGDLAKLSNREFEIVAMLSEGMRVTDVARKLNISVKTVSTHKRNALQKLGSPSVEELSALFLSKEVNNREFY